MGGGGLSLGAPRVSLTFLRRRPLLRPGLWAGVSPPFVDRHPTTASTEVLVQISITRGRHLLADRYPRVNGEGFPPARRAALAMLPGPPSWALCKSVPTRMYCPRGSSTELFLEHCQVGCV